MNIIIQSKPLTGDTWLFREEVRNKWSGIIRVYDVIKMDKRLKVKNDYRLVNKKGEVLLKIIPEEQS